MKKKSNIVIVISLIFILSILSGCIGSEDNTNSSKGEDFVFTTLDGNVKHLSDYRGRVVVLDLMGANCEPCVYEMFELKKIYENYGSDKVAILSIDVWVKYGETAQDLQAFKQYFSQHGVELDWTFGLDDKNGNIWNKYAKEGSLPVPTIYIFDQRGDVHFWHAGLSFFSEIPPEWPEDQPLPPLLAPKIDELLE